MVECLGSFALTRHDQDDNIKWSASLAFGCVACLVTYLFCTLRCVPEKTASVSIDTALSPVRSTSSPLRHGFHMNEIIGCQWQWATTNCPFSFTDLRCKDADVWLLVRKESIWINGSILFVLLSDFCKLWKPGSRMWQIVCLWKGVWFRLKNPCRWRETP